MAQAMRSQKARKRKGSLRKTALLGTGRMRLERRSSNLETPQEPSTQKSPPRSRNAAEYSRGTRGAIDGTMDTATSSTRRFSFEDDLTLADSETTPGSSTWTLRGGDAKSHLTLHTGRKSDDFSSPSTMTSPVRSPTYASTTDDDDGLTFTTATSLNNDLIRRRSSRSTHTNPQTLPHSPPAPIPTQQPPPEHDYSTTASWGWIILVVTWVVFVVGMGSCLDVWSWAWDVGETPYAPPELEDDPTLPIIGYYPALIVMTAVMAWVWVVVAWVGMKYFRHARYGEE
jgi:Phosphatidylinositol N-acetylglucosaminyltransferase subunit Y